MTETLTPAEKRQFERDWDARVKAAWAACESTRVVEVRAPGQQPFMQCMKCGWTKTIERKDKDNAAN